MIDVIDFIPSKDMREALRVEGRQFTDMEAATLVHNLGLPQERRRELLQQIADETQDERLRAQIAFGLANEQRKEEWFRTVAEGCVFGMRELDEEHPEDAGMDAYFATFDLAFEYGISKECPFEIRKWRVFDMDPDEQSSYPGGCGSMRFTADGALESARLWVTGDDERIDDGFEMAPWPVGTKEENWLNYQFFEDRWVDLPNLYDTGDIVRVLGKRAAPVDAEYDWAVVDTSQEWWQPFRERVGKWLADAEAGRVDPKGVMADYSDVHVVVDVPCKDGTFAHAHVNPMFLERVTEEAPEGSDEAKLRETAQEAVRGEIDLGWLSSVLERRILAAHAFKR